MTYHTSHEKRAPLFLAAPGKGGDSSVILVHILPYLIQAAQDADAAILSYSRLCRQPVRQRKIDFVPSSKY